MVSRLREVDDSESGRKDKEQRCGREGQRKRRSHKTEGLGEKEYVQKALRNLLQCIQSRLFFLLASKSSRKSRLPIGGTSGREPLSMQEMDAGLTPRLGRSSGGGPGSPLQYSCLEDPHG